MCPLPRRASLAPPLPPHPAHGSTSVRASWEMVCNKGFLSVCLSGPLPHQPGWLDPHPVPGCLCWLSGLADAVVRSTMCSHVRTPICTLSQVLRHAHKLVLTCTHTCPHLSTHIHRFSCMPASSHSHACPRAHTCTLVITHTDTHSLVLTINHVPPSWRSLTCGSPDAPS